MADRRSTALHVNGDPEKENMIRLGLYYASKLPIYMNSDFSLLPEAKTCLPITADACFI